MDEEKPLISIIIPVYNAEKYIMKTLDSVVAQTFLHIEVIVIDDESTDGSSQIIQKYCEQYNNFKYYFIDNKGVSNARNCGLKKSCGEFIIFLDSDDWLEPETCQIAYDNYLLTKADIVMWSYVREFKSHRIPKMIFSQDMIFEGKDLKKLHCSFCGTIEGGLFSPDNMDALSTVWGKMYKRKVVEGVQFHDIREIGSFEDGIFNLEVFGKTDRVSYINRYLYHYRKDNEASITSKYLVGLVEKRRKIYALLRKYVQRNNLDDTYIQAINNRAVYEILYVGLNEINNTASVQNKMENIKAAMDSDEFIAGKSSFPYKDFSIIWRLFYCCAIRGDILLTYIMLLCIQTIRVVRNK